MSAVQEPELVNAALTEPVARDSWTTSETYHCHLEIIREDDGGFSAVVLNLPGAGSSGDTEEDAIEGAREAVTGAILAYRESGQDIPWVDSTRMPIGQNSKQKWILVNA